MSAPIVDALASTRDRIGDIRDHELVGRAEALAENGFHGRTARRIGALL